MWVCGDDPCLWFMRRWMRSMRAKCFSCESHPEIGSRAGRRRERQVFSVHVDHKSKVYFSYCPPALIRVLAWRLCTKIPTSRFNFALKHTALLSCKQSSNCKYQCINLWNNIVFWYNLLQTEVFQFIAISVAFNAIHGDLLCTTLYAYFRTALEY